MRVLFVHQNFPGQYRHLAAHLAAQRGNQVVAISEKQSVARANARIPGITLLAYSMGKNEQSDPFVAPVLKAIHRGRIVLKELDGRIDLEKVSFVGRIPYADYLALLRRSAAHVYLTYPFVLPWSLLEAMACGCAVVGSRTPPVQEVIADGDNGFLVDFFDTAAIAAAVERALGRQAKLAALRSRARETVVARYDFKRVCLPAQLPMMGANLPAGRG